MGTFVGLDVSLKETSVCILDQDGTRVFEGKVASEPAAIARLIRKRAPDLARVGSVANLACAGRNGFERREQHGDVRLQGASL